MATDYSKKAVSQYQLQRYASLSKHNIPKVSVSNGMTIDELISDREYGEGKGYVILQKNPITQVMINADSSLDGHLGENLLPDIADTNTIYVVRYDFFNPKKVILATGSTISYEGGKITGKAVLDSTNLRLSNTNGVSLSDSMIGYDINIDSENKSCISGNFQTQKMNMVIDHPLMKTQDNQYIEGYNTSRLLGTKRFAGDVTFRGYSFEDIYASELICKGTTTSQESFATESYTTVAPDLYFIYNNLNNTINANDRGRHFRLILDIPQVCVTDTIQLYRNVSIVSNCATKLYLGTGFTKDANKNVFEASSTTTYRTANAPLEISGIVFVLTANTYANNFIKSKTHQWRFIFNECSISSNTDRSHYNHFFESYINELATSASCAYQDFMEVRNFHNFLGSAYSINNSGFKPDFIIYGGDCIRFVECERINVFSGFGQVIYESCMHLRIMHIGSMIMMSHCHLEDGFISLYYSKATIVSTTISNIPLSAKDVIEINNPACKTTAIGLGIDENFINGTEANLNNNTEINFIDCVYQICATQSVPANMYGKRYAIHAYDDNYNFNELPSTASWCNNGIITLASCNKYQDITFKSADMWFTFSNYTTQVYENTMTTWASYNDITSYLGNTYSDQSLTLSEKFVLLDKNRCLGKMLNISVSGTYNKGIRHRVQLTPTIQGSGIIVFNISLGGVEKQACVPILDSGNSSFNADFDDCHILGACFEDVTITSINECSKLDIIGEDNVRAYVSALPTYGTWNNGDEVVILGDGVYKYFGSWIKQLSLE